MKKKRKIEMQKRSGSSGSVANLPEGSPNAAVTAARMPLGLAIPRSRSSLGTSGWWMRGRSVYRSRTWSPTDGVVSASRRPRLSRTLPRATTPVTGWPISLSSAADANQDSTYRRPRLSPTSVLICLPAPTRRRRTDRRDGHTGLCVSLLVQSARR